MYYFFNNITSVMHRDLKPDNIGFDVRGDIKLCDFGLAKEFDPNRCDRDGLYKFTEDTGSPRYMDPLVALGLPYNESCDVYSFCVVLWQILQLELPFDHFTMNLLKKMVFKGNVRPKINDSWPTTIKEMMRNGWSMNFKLRPSMNIIEETLNVETTKYCYGHDLEEENDKPPRRRSFVSCASQ
jgi:serine/threonine protein kinase